MEYDTASAGRKRAELLQMTIAALPAELPQRETIAERIVAAFIQITPPAHEPPMLEMLTMESMGRRGGSSRKPGNIFLRPKTLIEIIPDIILTAAGVAGQQWVIPFAGLHIWNTLWSNSRIDLDRNHAMAIYAMWTNRNGEDRIPEDDAFTKTNEQLTASGFSPLNKAEFAEIIDALCKMDCIELNNGMIWLREWVRTTYE